MSVRGRAVLFARKPVLGAVKTRLAAAIGDEAALAFYRETLAGALDRLGADPRFDLAVAVTPDEAARDRSDWPAALRLEPQGPGDLGARMGRQLARATRDRPVVVVGSDIPELGPDDVAAAMEALRTHDLAFGPARDGGYWLVGSSAEPPPGLFADVRWSSEFALADTLRNVGALRVATLRVLDDVDDAAGYARFRARQAQALQDAPPRTQNLAQ